MMNKEMDIANLMVELLYSDEEKRLIDELILINDEYELYKELREKLEKDPGFYYDLSVILSAAGTKVIYCGKKHDNQNKNMIIPVLNMAIVTHEYLNEDNEWVVNKNDVYRL